MKNEMLIINGGFIGNAKPQKDIETLEDEVMMPTVLIDGVLRQRKSLKPDKIYERSVQDVVPMLPTGACIDCED